MQTNNLENMELFSESKVWKEDIAHVFWPCDCVLICFLKVSVSGGCFYVLYLSIYSSIWGFMCIYFQKYNIGESNVMKCNVMQCLVM